jgi:hypothetical protein
MPLSRSEFQKVDPYLTNLSIEYANRPDAFIGTKLMPVIPTGGEISGLFKQFAKANRFKDYDGKDKRSRLARSGQVHSEMGDDQTFACNEYSLHDGVYQRDYKVFLSKGLDLVEYAIQLVVDALMMGREKRISALLQSGSVLTNTAALSGNDRWDVFTSESSDPFADVETMRNSIHSLTALDLNTLAVGRQVYNQLKQHPSIIERIKFTMTAIGKNITPALMAQAFDVEEFLVGNPLRVTTDEGQAATLGYIWGKNVIGAFVNRSAPTNRTQMLGSIFSVEGNEAPIMAKWYEDGVKGTFVEGTIDEDEKVVDANCAYLFTTVVS